MDKPPESHALERVDPQRYPWSLQDSGSVAKGFWLVVAFHLWNVLVPYAWMFMGVTQLAYVVPLSVVYRKQARTVQGLAIAAGITFLLNCACFFVGLHIFSHSH